MGDTLQSDDMTPKVYRPMWKCRHCKHEWPIEDEEVPPYQCANRKCRRADWHRNKIKIGRPRKGAPKLKTGRPAKKRRGR